MDQLERRDFHFGLSRTTAENKLTTRILLNVDLEFTVLNKSQSNVKGSVYLCRIFELYLIDILIVYYKAYQFHISSRHEIVNL